MLTLIKGFIELIGAIIILVAIKVQITFWLAVVLGVLVLAIGIYSAFQKQLRAIIEIGSAVVILLHLIPIAMHPAISMPVGIILFIVAAGTIVQILIE